MPSTYLQQESDASLLALVAGRDQGAFELLYRRYERRALGYARQLLRDVSAAEDVFIDAMTTVWKSAASFNGASQVSTWILGIVRHKALDRMRSDLRRGRTAPLEDASHIADQGNGPADAFAQNDAAVTLNGVFHRLSSEHQEALRLAFFEGLPYAEIAELLGIPPNTVKTRVYHAKLQLRRLLDEAAPGDKP